MAIEAAPLISRNGNNPASDKESDDDDVAERAKAADPSMTD